MSGYDTTTSGFENNGTRNLYTITARRASRISRTPRAVGMAEREMKVSSLDSQALGLIMMLAGLVGPPEQFQCHREVMVRARVARVERQRAL